MASSSGKANKFAPTSACIPAMNPDPTLELEGATKRFYNAAVKTMVDALCGGKSLFIPIYPHPETTEITAIKECVEGGMSMEQALVKNHYALRHRSDVDKNSTFADIKRALQAEYNDHCHYDALEITELGLTGRTTKAYCDWQTKKYRYGAAKCKFASPVYAGVGRAKKKTMVNLQLPRGGRCTEPVPPATIIWDNFTPPAMRTTSSALDRRLANLARKKTKRAAIDGSDEKSNAAKKARTKTGNSDYHDDDDDDEDEDGADYVSWSAQHTGSAPTGEHAAPSTRYLTGVQILKASEVVGNLKSTVTQPEGEEIACDNAIWDESIQWAEDVAAGKLDRDALLMKKLKSAKKVHPEGGTILPCEHALWSKLVVAGLSKPENELAAAVAELNYFVFTLHLNKSYSDLNRPGTLAMLQKYNLDEKTIQAALEDATVVRTPLFSSPTALAALYFDVEFDPVKFLWLGKKHDLNMDELLSASRRIWANAWDLLTLTGAQLISRLWPRNATVEELNHFLGISCDQLTHTKAFLEYERYKNFDSPIPDAEREELENQFEEENDAFLAALADIGAEVEVDVS